MHKTTHLEVHSPGKHEGTTVNIKEGGGQEHLTTSTAVEYTTHLQQERQGLPILRLGDRQERKRSYFQYATNEIPRTDDTPTTRYSRMTAVQISKTIQEANVRTLNGYALHKQIEGYKDCYLAKSIHGTGICLKARHKLSMGENDAPRNR